MHFRVMTKPDISDQLLPFEEIFEQVRGYSPDEEQLLHVYRQAAIDAAERISNRAIGLQTVVATFEHYRHRTYLPYGEIKTVERVEAFNVDGDLVLIEPTLYTVNQASNEIILNRKLSNYKDFQVTYQVGYEVFEVPAVMKVGMLKLISTWFDAGREDVALGVSVSEIPMNHKACFELYRIAPSL
ncbi:hypothetical protein [Vibrio vulnificus]|uniref:hypothetical protein n=1 Tax=Vibrio vulnificus TaxID=672 RepID=UPI00324277DD